MRGLALALFCTVLVVASCARKKPRIAGSAPAPAAGATAGPTAGTTERGVASWYGKPYDGRAAADGEIYDMETLVAAHRTLPFQTVVRVRNVGNEKTVDVRIIDRGPFIQGR